MNEQCSQSAMAHFMHCTDVHFQELQSPFLMLRAKLFIDGNQWCALYGDNIQDGVCGFGDTPIQAKYDFDKNFYSQKAIACGDKK